MEVIVVLLNIRSVYNVASIFRTADGAGVSKIYLVGATPTPLDRFGKFRADFSKVALGAEQTVEWEYFKNFGAVYKKLKSAGGRNEILAVEQDKKAIPYYEYKMKPIRQAQGENKRVALIFGEETKGLPKSVLNKADKILEIPMRGKMVRQAHHPKNEKTLKLRGKESLNVSVATGILVYYIMVGHNE